MAGPVNKAVDTRFIASKWEKQRLKKIINGAVVQRDAEPSEEEDFLGFL